MTARVLLCNAGSSSLKVQISDPSGARTEAMEFAGKPAEVVARFKTWLLGLSDMAVALHRIVHAGAVDERPRQLDAALRERIHHWQSLAPLHNALALELIAAVEQRWPLCKQLAIFDSGVFSELPPLSKLYALPSTISPRWPVQRYGFHGLAHRSQLRKLQALGEFNRVITLQLGGGTSATAWRNQVPVDTTMGFTLLEGLPMGSRSGSIDPGILLHLLQNEGSSPAALQRLLNESSGLKALSGGSSDMRELLASDTDSAQFAVEYYCYQLRKTIGAFIAILGGIDAIAIGGGIGEHQAKIRSRIFNGLSHLSLTLSETANTAAQGVSALHATGAGAEIWLTPVDEAAEMLLQYAQYKRMHSL